MRNSSEKEHNDTSIPVIQTRFEKLVETPRSLLIKAFLTIQEVQDRLKILLEDDTKRRNSATEFKKKIEKLPPFIGKGNKK